MPFPDNLKGDKIDRFQIHPCADSDYETADIHDDIPTKWWAVHARMSDFE